MSLVSKQAEFFEIAADTYALFWFYKPIVLPLPHHKHNKS